MQITLLLSLLLLMLGSAGQRTTFIAQNTSSASACLALPFSDSFTHPDGALPPSWTNPSTAPIQIVSNAATVPAFTSGDNVAFVNCPGFTTSHYAQVTVPVTGSSNTYGLAVSATDANNYYYVGCENSGCNMFTRVAGSDTYVNSWASTTGAGDRICLELDSGTSVKFRVNGTYDSLGSVAVSGLSSGAGGVFFGSMNTGSSTMTTFSTGNGTCPP